MDLSLFESAVKLHGFELDRLIKEEQGASFLDDVVESSENVTSALNDEDNATSTLALAKKSKETSSSSMKQKVEDKNARGHFAGKLHSFIARKADLIFAKPDDDDALPTFPSEKDAEKSDYYAILPPLEQFLEVRPDVCQERLFDLLRVGDVVIGQILSTKEFGIFVKLLALCQDTSRFLEESEVVALLPAAELRDKFSHVASVDDFQIGDHIRALVIKVNTQEQKVIISLHAREECKEDSILGLITESELPVHYRRSIVQLDTQEIYQDMLHNTVGFDNPFNVAYLGAKLGLNDACPLSLMRGLQRSNFPEKEYAEPLRKWQTNRWSMESVAKGVEYFKAGKLLDAMQHLNKALEIDEENVEALVARGALYANKDLLSKALQDFGKALKINPNHRNANKYMCQTLIERGKQHEEAGETEKAADCYQTAIDIKPDFLEAQLCLSNINRARTPAKKPASPESITSSSPMSPGATHISVEALRQLVQLEKDVSQPSKTTVKKTKKKKKKTTREKDKSSKKRDLEERHSRESQRKFDQKKRKHSSNFDNHSSESSESSRSGSRSLHRSGKYGSRDERKLQRSASRKGKKGARRRSHHSDSYSWSSSSDRSPYRTLRSRSRSRQHSGRKSSKQERNRTGRRSASSLRSSNSDGLQSSRSRSRNRQPSKRNIAEVPTKHDKSSSSKRKSIVVKRRSRRSASRSLSCSHYSGSDSSFISVSPKSSRQRSKSRSLDDSRRKSSRDDRSSRKETKTSERIHCPSLSPRSRHRNLSQESRESRSSKTDSMKRHSLQLKVKKVETVSDVKEKESIRSRSVSNSRDGFQQSPRTESRDKSPTEGKFKSKQRKEVQSATVKSPLRKRELDIKKSSDVVEQQREENSKWKRDAEDFDKQKLNEASKLKHETSRQSKETKSDSCSSSLNSIPGKIRDGIKSMKDQGSNSGDAKTHGRRGKGLDDRRSRSRSFSSDGSYSDGSYTSYSLSGSRSYSYSSYSSSRSYSDSDDSYYSKKESGNKPKQSKRLSMQGSKASKEAQGKPRMSELRKKGDKQRYDEDDDSNSDVDTGIYEISRDHLEMYMDSKSYQIKKVDDDPLLRGKRRWQSYDKDEIVSHKKSKSVKRRKGNSDDDKESRKTAKPVSESQLALDPTIKTKSMEVSSQKDGTEIPLTAPLLPSPPIFPARDQDVKSVKEDDFSHAAYIQSSIPNVSLSQLLEPHIGHHQPVVSDKGSLQSVVPDIDPYQPRESDVYEGPSQSLEHRVPQPLIKSENISQQNPILQGNLNQSSISKTDKQKLILGPKPDRNVQGTSCHTTSDAGANMSELSQQKMFTLEQLSVIESISNQLAHTHQKTSHPTRSEENFDTEATQHDQRHQKGHDVIGGQTPAQGHCIGVIVTQRSSDLFEESIPPQSLATTNPSVDDHNMRNRRRRWDVKTSDKDREKDLETRHFGGGAFHFEDSKPVSFDYQHGQDIDISSNASINIKLRELREREAFVSDRSRETAYDQPESTSFKAHSFENASKSSQHREEKQGRDTERGDVLGVVKWTPEKHEHHYGESAEKPEHGSHNSSRGQWSHDERPRGQSSEDRTHYYSTRHDRVEVKTKNVPPNLSASKVQFVDYQHGRSDRHHERSRMRSDKTRNDSHEKIHHDDRHRSSYERRSDQSEHRSSYEHRSNDRQNYHDRDRHRDTHRDRYRRRSSDTHSGRTHSRNQGSGMPVQPKESNPFFQLVSSSKDMQVASLHSAGKWGHNYSPKEAKSCSRSWWL